MWGIRVVTVPSGIKGNRVPLACTTSTDPRSSIHNSLPHFIFLFIFHRPTLPFPLYYINKQVIYIARVKMYIIRRELMKEIDKEVVDEEGGVGRRGYKLQVD